MYSSLLSSLGFGVLIAAILAVAVLCIGYLMVVHASISIMNFLDRDVFGYLGEWKSYHPNTGQVITHKSQQVIFPRRRPMRRSRW